MDDIDEVFQVVPAAYLFLLRGEDTDVEVLLQLRGPESTFMSGHWAAAAAGHVEYGEDVFAAARREAREELALDVAEPDMVPLCTMQRTLPGVADPVEQRVDFFLTARSWSGKPTIAEPGKSADLGWFPLTALPSPLVPHEKTVLQLLARDAAGGKPVPAIVTSGF